jgi:hypothetical protein
MQWFSEHAPEVFLGVVMAILSFFGKRELNRIDQKADGAALNAAIEVLKRHVDDDRIVQERITERLDTIAETLTETQVAVAKIVGRLERD